MSSCEKARQWQAAIALLQELVHQLLTPNVISYNVAISVCEKGAEWLLPFELLEEMRQWELSPHVVSYSAVISACEKGVRRRGTDFTCSWRAWDLAKGTK
jgi:pentatricopeptide repeat domain-containing protein 1